MGKRLYPIILILLVGCGQQEKQSYNPCEDGFFLSGTQCVRHPFEAKECPVDFVKVSGKCYKPGIYYTEEIK